MSYRLLSNNQSSAGQIRFFQTIAFLVITILLASAIGTQISEIQSNQESIHAGIDVKTIGSDVEITWLSEGTADTIIIEYDNSEQTSTLRSVGDSVSISNYTGNSITIIAKNDTGQTTLRVVKP